MKKGKKVRIFGTDISRWRPVAPWLDKSMADMSMERGNLGAVDVRASYSEPIYDDEFRKMVDSNKAVGLAMKNLGEIADEATITFRDVSMSFQKAAEIMEKERLEEIKKIPLPMCPVCGSIMRLVEPGEGKTWTEFFGCTRYTDGCRGTRNILSMGVPSGNTEAYEAETDDVEAVCPQ